MARGVLARFGVGLSRVGAPLFGLVVLGLVAAALVQADEVELRSGIRVKGKVKEVTGERVVILVDENAGRSMSFPLDKVRAITRDGRRQVVAGPAEAAASGAAKPSTGAASLDAVRAAVRQPGEPRPEWWDAEPFEPPPSLDLTWKTEGWKPNENVGTHLFIVCPKPEKWKYAIKLLDKLLGTVGEKDERRRRECMILMGDFYSRLEDWPRAAFWWSRAGVAGGHDQPYGLVRCFWKMGQREAALKALDDVRVDSSYEAKGVRLLTEMGEIDRALRMAEATAGSGRPAPAYLAAGDACRRAGEFARAADYYQKVINVKGDKEDLKHFRDRAQLNLAGVKAFDGVNLAKIPDGRYEGSSTAFRGPLVVEVSMQAGKIASVRVLQQKEDRAFDSLTTVPQAIVARQGIVGVDAITAATMTSEAVINAAASALGKAVRRP